MNIKTLILLITFLSMLSCNLRDKNEEYVNVLEAEKVQLSATVNGRITGLSVKEGDFVEKGTMLVQIDTTDFYLEKMNLLTSLRETGIALQIASEKEKSALSEKEYVSTNHKRTKALFDSGSATQQSLDDITELMKKTEYNYKMVSLEKERLQASQEKLKISLKKVEKLITDCCISAPFSGKINEIFFQQDEAVMAYRPILEMVDDSSFEVKLYLPVNEITNLKIGDKINLSIDSSQEVFNGSVSWISSVAEFTPKEILTPETRSSLVYAVVITAENHDNILKEGIPVIITLPETTGK